MIKVFFCEYTGHQVFTKMWWCESCNNVGKRVEVARGPENLWDTIPFEDEPPVACERCGKSARFSARGAMRIYRREDTGEEIITLRDHPGAVFEDEEGAWDSSARKRVFGPDGKSINIVLPNGRIWAIDSRASNCDMKEDHVHKCWVRHGDGRGGNIHVDKEGHTCNAGAGSILAGDYHGFLHHGYLKSC